MVITFLAIGQVLSILWHFEILTSGQLENRIMCNILKTAYHRTKQIKIWDSMAICAYVHKLHMWGYFACLIRRVQFGVIR